MNTFKEYILENYDIFQLRDIAIHGCSGGISGFIYYTETSEFYNKYHNEIWDKLYEDYADLGYSNIMDMIASFNGSKDVAGDEQFKNLLVWYYVEEIAKQRISEAEESEE